MNNNKQQTYLLLLVFAILYLPQFLVRDPWSPDEPRYVEITRQVGQTSTPLLLRINGELYAEKPPLFFYLAALFDFLAPSYGTRIVETGSLLVFVFVLRALITPGAHLQRLTAPLIFMTTFIIIEIGRFAVIDSLFLCFLALGILFGRRAILDNRPLRNWLLCYAALALGNLVKGPVILPFAVIALIASRKESTGSFLPRGGLGKHLAGHLSGIILFAVLTLSWLVPACLQGGESYTDTLIGQILGRVTGTRESHNEPVYFYLFTMFHVFLPWTALLAAALFAAWKLPVKNRWVFAWFVLGFVLLSIFRSKRSRYLVFLAQPASLLVADYCAHLSWNAFNKAMLRITAGVQLAASLALIAGGPAVYFLRSDLSVFGKRAEQISEVIRPMSAAELWGAYPLAGMAAFIIALLGWKAAGALNPRKLILSLTAFVCITSLVFDFGITPHLNPVKAGTEFTEQLKSYAETHNTAFFLHRTDFDGRINRIFEQNTIPIISNYRKVLAGDRPAAVIMGLRMDSLSAYIARVKKRSKGIILAKGWMGGRTMLLVGNEAAAR